MIKKALRTLFRLAGYDVVNLKIVAASTVKRDFERIHLDIIRKVQPYTMTSPERLHALIEATRYVIRNGIRGDFVECGVYKGGVDDGGCPCTQGRGRNRPKPLPI